MLVDTLDNVVIPFANTTAMSIRQAKLSTGVHEIRTNRLRTVTALKSGVLARSASQIARTGLSVPENRAACQSNTAWQPEIIVKPKYLNYENSPLDKYTYIYYLR